MMTAVESRVREIAEHVAASYGLEVVDVELRGGGKARALRITIDREPSSAVGPGSPAEGTAGEGARATQAGSGVTLEDCQNLSREVGTILDVENVVPGASYTLEVSSPGLDRKLVRQEDYQRFTGSRVKLWTREPVNGQKHFDGRLESFRDGLLTLELPTSKRKKKRQPEASPARVQIELGNVERANLAPEF